VKKGAESGFHFDSLLKKNVADCRGAAPTEGGASQRRCAIGDLRAMAPVGESEKMFV